MIRRWSCLSYINIIVRAAILKKWKRPKFLYKRIIKFKKYKFYRLAKIRSNRRRKFGNFRNSLTQVRLSPFIGSWSIFLNLKNRYKSYIWLVNYSNFFLQNFERYSILFYNKKFPHPVQAQSFYMQYRQLEFFTPPLIPHRSFKLSKYKKKNFNLILLFEILLLQILKMIASMYTIIQYSYLSFLLR